MIVENILSEYVCRKESTRSSLEAKPDKLEVEILFPLACSKFKDRILFESSEVRKRLLRLTRKSVSKTERKKKFTQEVRKTSDLCVVWTLNSLRYP